MNDYRCNQDDWNEETKRIRFELYNQVIQEHGANGIFLAHHKNDEQENISNIVNGRSLWIFLWWKISQKQNITIFRPFINLLKKYLWFCSQI